MRHAHHNYPHHLLHLLDSYDFIIFQYLNQSQGLLNPSQPPNVLALLDHLPFPLWREPDGTYHVLDPKKGGACSACSACSARSAQGLLINLIHFWWPSLAKMPGFLKDRRKSSSFLRSLPAVELRSRGPAVFPKKDEMQGENKKSHRYGGMLFGGLDVAVACCSRGICKVQHRVAG